MLLVDDSDSYRMALSLALSRDKSIQIIGQAADGKTALALLERLRPDVVLMDVIMPRLDGIETARTILRTSTAAVVLMSVIARYPEQLRALDKLPLGSVELTDKPVLVGPAGEANVAALVRRIKTAAHSHIRRLEGMSTPVTVPSTCQIIAIAASTGGMEASKQVLEHLKPGFPPVVIAQHVDPEFAERFVVLLRNSLHLPVTAVDGVVPLRPGFLHVAAHHRHIHVRPGAIHSTPAQSGELAPNADHLFLSIAEWYGDSAVGVILTGMGQDGALGLKAIRDAGGWTIAQDDRSALVYGMPRAALEAGACREVLPLERIAERLTGLRPHPRLPERSSR